jgi:hypothetical protein
VLTSKLSCGLLEATAAVAAMMLMLRARCYLSGMVPLNIATIIERARERALVGRESCAVNEVYRTARVLLATASPERLPFPRRPRDLSRQQGRHRRGWSSK